MVGHRLPAMSEQPCPKCGTPCAVTPRPDTQHWGEIRCPEHGHAWVRKPTEAQAPRRKTNHDLRKAVPEPVRSRCCYCLRPEDHLKSLRPSVCLQVHHVIEVSKGGTDDLWNLQLVCAECHAEIHRRREAFARYASNG